MEKGLSLDHITSSLLTLQKLKKLYSSTARQEDGIDADDIQLDKLSLFRDTLTAVAGFLPETRGSSVSEAFRQGSHYCGAYRSMKQQVREINGNRLDSAQVLKSLRLVTPVLSNKQRLYMDKVVRIFDILQS